MEDTQIIELYFARDEQALTRSSEKYGGLCMSIAQRILNSRPDSEECVNDTWLGAWNSIPPANPFSLSAFLSRITRNLAVDRLRRKTAQKRGFGEYSCALSELDECIPDPGTAEERTYVRELGRTLNAFLATEAALDRKIFVSRYFYCETTAQTAEKLGLTQGQVKVRLHRCRERLRKYLRSQEFDL